MSQAESNSSAAKTEFAGDVVGAPNSAAKGTTLSVLGSAGATMTLCVACLLTIFVAIASAQESEHASNAPYLAALPAGGAEVTAPTFDLAMLPTIDSIDARTDITIFLQGGVPAEMQLAALRRAWRMDPAIRDFRSLQENDWDFQAADSIPGFGELGPEVDVKRMVAEIFGDLPRLAALLPRRSDESNRSSSFAASARRLIFGAARD